MQKPNILGGSGEKTEHPESSGTCGFHGHVNPSHFQGKLEFRSNHSSCRLSTITDIQPARQIELSTLDMIIL